MQTYITLNDGTKIPQFGLGVYQVPEGEAPVKAGVQRFTGDGLQKAEGVFRRQGTPLQLQLSQVDDACLPNDFPRFHCGGSGNLIYNRKQKGILPQIGDIPFIWRQRIAGAGHQHQGGKRK